MRDRFLPDIFDPSSRRQRLAIILVLLFTGFILFFYKVGDRDLWAPDEDEYAQMSREMLRFDHWAFPTVNGEPWAIKPLLYNWLMALSSTPWGDVNEFRARVFSSLAALGTFLATFYLGKRMFSPFAGLIAAAVLGTSPLFLQYARWSQTHMLSTFFMTLSVFLFHRGYVNPAKRDGSYLFMYVSVGLGVLTMGPVNLIMPGMVVFFYLIVMKDPGHMMQLKPVWGIIIFLAITAPWYVLISLKEGYVFDLLVKTNFTRYFKTWVHAAPFYYYLVNLPLVFFPWSLFLPSALFLAFSSRSLGDRGNLKFILTWAVSLLVFFSLSDGKRTPYTLPIYPALALLVGYLGAKAVEHWPGQYYKKAIMIPSLILLVVLTMLTVAVPLGTRLFVQSWFLPGLVAGVITGTFAWLIWLAWRKNRVQQLLFLPAALMLVAIVYSVHVVIPRLEHHKSPRPFCDEIVTRLEDGGTWAMYRFYRAAFVYYTDSFVRVLHNAEQLNDFLNRPEKSLVATKEQEYEKVKPLLEVKTYLLETKKAGHTKMVLFSNRQD